MGETSPVSDSRGHKSKTERPYGQLSFRPNLGCGICYESVSDPATASPMLCCHPSHILHHHCAFKWYLAQRQRGLPPQCPFCRHEIMSAPAFDSIYTLTYEADRGPPPDTPIYTFADEPSPYFNHSLHLVQLTNASYALMTCNIIFIVWILTKLCM